MRLIIIAVVIVQTMASIVSAADYFPLTKGNQWVYTVVNTPNRVHTSFFNSPHFSRSISNQDSLEIMEIVKDTLYKNKLYYIICLKLEMSGMIADVWYSYLYSTDDFIYAIDSLKDPQVPAFVAKHRFQDNEWFIDEGDTMRVRFAGSVVVKNKTYQDCYQVCRDNGETLCFAPDVGMVIMKEESISVLELKSYLVNITAITNKAPADITAHGSVASLMPSGIYDLRGRRIGLNKNASLLSCHNSTVYAKGLYIITQTSGHIKSDWHLQD